MSVAVNPEYKISDHTLTSKKVDFAKDEMEVVDCDTILGLCSYHLFLNKENLCTWIRNSKVGEIHILTLLYPMGGEVSVNTTNSVFVLNSQNPLIRIIFTPSGFKKIQD